MPVNYKFLNACTENQPWEPLSVSCPGCSLILPLQSLAVGGSYYLVSIHFEISLSGTRSKLGTHRSTCDGQLKLSLCSSHQCREVIAYTLQDAKPIVLGQRSQEVLDGVPFVSPSSVLQKLLYNLGLVRRAQGRGLQDDRQFRVFLQDG